MVLLSALLLGTVLTGPAAQPARDPGLTDPFGPQLPRPAAARPDLRDPFASVGPEAGSGPARSTGPVTTAAPVRRTRARASADLRDPFAPDSAGEVAARRPAPQPTSLDLAGPFQGPSKGEAAARRIVPLSTTAADLRDPFAG